MDLIIYPNPRIDQTLLLDGIQRYNNKTNKPVNIRILKSTINTSTYEEDQDILKLFMEIRQDKFYCKAYAMENGKMDKSKTRTVQASWETILFCYTLKKEYDGNYRVENDTLLFNLLNYALQEQGKIMRGNRQGFKNISYYEIIDALKNLNFKAIVKETNGQQYIVPSYWEEITILNE